MALFGRPSEQLIQRYRDNVVMLGPSDPLPIRPKQVSRFRFKPEHLAFRPLAGGIDCLTLLRVPLEIYKSDCEISYVRHLVDPTVALLAVSSAPLQLAPLEIRQGVLLSTIENRAITVGLLGDSDTPVHTVDLTSFNPVITRFSFPSMQPERQSLLTGQRTRVASLATRVDRVSSPEPPPSFQGADLQERLRSILTPPIHEVLSDPQLGLPERPFPFQAIGIKWLYDRDCALLSDEMGLGKTMQAILAARLLWRDNRLKQILVVAPKSLIPNWCRELEKWWPGIWAYTQVVGNDRQWFLRAGHPIATVKLINYESLQRELDWLKEREVYHDLVILDEAQRIKNPESKRSQAVKALKAERRWALTGTPLENSVDDLVSVLGFVKPGLGRVDIQLSQTSSAAN
jgi:SNF2 family DNA or RNA helicase